MEEMPMKGFGTFIGIELNRIDSDEERFRITKQSILSALSIGYRHFDLASNYSNLEAVKEAFEEGFKSVDEGGFGINREDVWITMKANVSSEAEINLLLEKTGLTYFDLYLEHYPVGPESLETKWQMLCDIPAEKIHHKGVSNYYQNHLVSLIAICDSQGLEKPYANEIEINIYNQEDELVRYCQEQDIKVIAYSPLAYQMSSFLPEFSEEIQSLGLVCNNMQFILAWLLSRGICVIPSSRNPEHQIENFSIDHLINKFGDEKLLSKIKGYEIGEPVTGTAAQFKEASKTFVSRRYGPSL